MSEEQPTEDAETMKEATGSERVVADIAEKEYSEAKAAADIDRNSKSEAIERAKQVEKNKANSALNRKALESLNGKPFTDTEWAPFEKAINEVNESNPVDIDDPSNAGSDANIDSVQNAARIEINSNLPSDVKNSLDRSANSTAEAVSADSLKELSSADKSKLKDSQNKIESAGKDFGEAIKEGNRDGIKDALEKISKEKKNIEDIMENSTELKNKTESEGGRDSWNWKKVLTGLGKLLKVLAPFGLVLLALKLISDSISGCYQYTGEQKRKIGCPSDSKNQQYCSCGEISKIYYQPTDKKNVCISGQTIMNYPFCCGSQYASPIYPLCSDPTSGTAGKDSYVYYGYEQYSISDVIANSIKVAIEAVENVLSQLFSILKWVAIGIGILIVVFIAFKLFSGFFNKKENQERIEYVQYPSNQSSNFSLTK